MPALQMEHGGADGARLYEPASPARGRVVRMRLESVVSDARYDAVALRPEDWRCIVQRGQDVWGTEDDPAALAAELRDAGFMVQRVGNVVRIVREPRV